MNYSLIDAGGLTLSVLSYIPLILTPGLALARVGGLWTPTAPAEAPTHTPATLAAILAGFVALPVLDSLIVRYLGLSVALGFNLILAVLGAVVALRAGWRPRLSWTDGAALALWLVVVIAEWIDFDTGGGLRQPYLIIDLVKHAATTQAIHDTGAPPIDPFFLRPARASYYYFFYTLTALSERLGGGLFDARAAVGGLVFWTGVALYALVRVAISRAALVATPWSRRVGVVCLAVMAIGGLDILPVVRMGLAQGEWLPDPASWNEQVTSLIGSLLWVPHHVTAAMASLVGLMLLSEETPDPWRRRAVFAGACFASALGLSIWVTLAAVVTAGCWMVGLVLSRKWRMASGLAVAGGVSIILASFQILDLHTGRASGALPIALTVRAFSPVEHALGPGPLRLLARLVTLPLNYFAEFGLLASGALLFWRERREPWAEQSEFARLLVIAALCGLGLGAFLKSTYYNNDLGWRVMLFPLLAGTAWTVAALERRFASPSTSSIPARIPALLWGLGAVGAATSVYFLVNNRTFADLPLPAENRFMEADARTQRELRTAYAWANAHLPPSFVLQHNPTPPRVFAFGLYSRNRVAVADAQAGLYGASDAAVAARGNALAPLFTQSLSIATVRERAKMNGVDALVIDLDDPVWATPASWVWASKPLYSTDRVRIIATTALGSP